MSRFLVNPDGDKPRILHLLKWLPRGGIETWLTHIFDASVGGSYQHEVLLMQDEIGPYETKVRNAGVYIHRLPMDSRARWFLDLYRFLKKAGPFAAFHAHVDSIVSGPALATAAAAGIPARIIHNHAARSMGSDYQKLRYRVREGIGNALAMSASTRAIGISEMAMVHLAGVRWRQRQDCTLLLYGFDYSAFHGALARSKVLRAELGIAPEATVIGHVGRFDPVKNHEFLLQSFARYKSADPGAVLVLVGRGPLQDRYEMLAQRLGIAQHVRFAGGTDDIPAYMSMFDIFAFPSFSEGLGIVVLEAQAAGTPVLMPENMPQEVIVIEEGVTTLPLDHGVTAWADMIGDIIRQPKPQRSVWLQRVEKSPFGMERCITELNAIYREEIVR